MNNLYLYGNFNATYQIRSVTHEGKPYLVVPVVMMVEVEESAVEQ